MGVKWTDEQEDAIASRGGSILVSAAAGSGKTAVLVERAVMRLTDPDHPTPADRLLIVTFTKAAAAQMRARIEKRLRELMRSQPQNMLLRRQSLLLPHAHIGTIDSFCADVVREFFHASGTAPDFKIISDKRMDEMIEEAMSEAVDAAFEAGGINELADAFTGERDDRRLFEAVKTLYDFMQSHPYPEKWLAEMISIYEKPYISSDSPWAEALFAYAKEALEYSAGALRRLRGQIEEAQDDKLSGAYSSSLDSDSALCITLLETAEARDWDGLREKLRSAAFERLGSVRGDEYEYYRRLVKDAHAVLKDTVKKLAALFSQSAGECAEDAAAVLPVIKSFATLTLDFADRYTQKKADGGFLDYSDLEHTALRLFIDEDGGKTPLALELEGNFDEIMIDEYQDINEVQDNIFRAVAKTGLQGEQENLFIVGDVKQSIYGFRRAMPEIFIGRRESFERYDRQKQKYPAYIVLGRNFRSRADVIESVNFVFSELMSRNTGGIEYGRDEELVCAADYPEKQNCETELFFLNRDGRPMEEIEAEHIAGMIKKMMEEGFTVTEDGRERPVRFGDFCILLRSANKYAFAYAQKLESLGIPARASVSGGFFQAAEVNLTLSLLKVIDNPDQDIPLLAALKSPIYGFSPEELARLRVKDRECSVYVSLLRAAAENGKAAAFFEDLADFRTLAATMPSDAFISLLYLKTGLTDIVLAMADGEARLANLRLLQRYAREYESSGYSGISGFSAFMERVRQSGSDMDAAGAGGSDRSVNVMSIHRSKGLEFPVCFVAGCGRRFVTETDEVLLHPKLGLGMKLKDIELGAKFTTMPRDAISIALKNENIAEELRLLYVAMTRAREKLVLISSVENTEKLAEKLASGLEEERISPYMVKNASSPSHWLLLCALRHPDGRRLREAAGIGEEAVKHGHYTPWKIEIVDKTEEETAVLSEQKPAPADMQLLERLRTSMAFRYPYEGINEIPSKVSASALSKEERGGELILARPAWLQQKGMTAAERGTALHEFMQFCDFRAAVADSGAELRRLVEGQFITEEQAGAIELDKVRAFFESPLGKRVLASEDVRKERRFTAEIPAGIAMQNAPAGFENEKVILQGAVDCTFVEDGRLNIIDFKTDRKLSAEELWQMYSKQLELYAFAMAEVSGLETGDCLIYSMYSGDAYGIGAG